jgi:hypothetical protein
MGEKALVIHARQQTEQSVGVRRGSLAARYHLNAPFGQDRTVARRRAGRLPWRLANNRGSAELLATFSSYFRTPGLAEARSPILQIIRECEMTLGFLEQLLDPDARLLVQAKAQHLPITINVHLDDAWVFHHRGSSHKGTEASATGVPEADASTQSASRMSGVAADYTIVIRSR